VSEERHGAFGQDAFGRAAERAARFFGTPQYIIGQSIVVVFWIALNSVALVQHWDPYPFILLNLAFSTQAAYAAPLILLAQTRQADRDKLAAEMLEKHRSEVEAGAARREQALARISHQLQSALDENTELTRQIHDLLQRSR
jgi:uncharacterized membrane protein